MTSFPLVSWATTIRTDCDWNEIYGVQIVSMRMQTRKMLRSKPRPQWMRLFDSFLIKDFQNRPFFEF